jgi:hypothetical protein
MILLPTLVVNCGFALSAPYPPNPRFTEGVVTYTSMKWVLFWASASMLLSTQWTRLLGVGSSILGNSLATDRASNVYLSGAASVALEGNTYAGTGDVFIAKYDLNGDRLWIREMRLAIVDARDRDL